MLIDEINFEDSFLDLINERVILLDKEYKILKANRAAKEFFEESSDEYFDCVCQGVCAFKRYSRNKVCPAVEAKQERKLVSEELITKTGEVWEVKVYPLFDEQNEIDGFVELMIDITERKTAEQLLRESEKRFRNMYKEAGIGIALTDLEGRPIITNPAFQDILGYTEDELKELKFTEFTFPDDIELDMNMYKELIRKERDTYQINKRYLKKNGELIWGRLTVTVVDDDKNNPIYTVAMVEDITKRVEAEIALQESEEKFRTIFEQAREGFLLRKLDGTIIDANQSLLDTFGYSKHVIEGRNVKDFNPYETEETLKQRTKETKEKGFNFYEVQARKSDGTLFPLEAQSNLNKIGDKEFVFAVFRDITERKKAELELMERKEMLESIINNSPFGFAAFDENEEIISVNPALLEMLGYSQEELSSKTLIGITHPEDIAISLKIGRKTLYEDQTAATFEKRYIAKDGTVVPTRVVTWGTYDEKGNLLYSFGSIEDITERQQAGELRSQSYNQIEQNIRNFEVLVDRIRNPLAVISGAAELEKTSYSDKIIENVGKISEISNLISTSLVESKKFRQILQEQLSSE